MDTVPDSIGALESDTVLDTWVLVVVLEDKASEDSRQVDTVEASSVAFAEASAAEGESVGKRDADRPLLQRHPFHTEPWTRLANLD